MHGQELSKERASDRLGAFAATVERFGRLARQEGLSVRPFPGTAPEWFPRLPEPLQAAVLEHWRRYVEVCEETQREGHLLRQDGHFLWRMFGKLGVRPRADLMSVIEQGDIVEIYNSDFVQIYRNLPFFEVCSYSLDELLSRPFFELFRRDEPVTAAIVGVAQKMLAGEMDGIYAWPIGVHTIEETESPLRLRSVIEQKFVSPLYDATGRPVALLNTIRCHSSVPGVTAEMP